VPESRIADTKVRSRDDYFFAMMIMITSPITLSSITGSGFASFSVTERRDEPNYEKKREDFDRE
jgi:hypothetical protein